MLAKIFGDNKDLALLLIRVVLGLIFFFYGWKHVANITPAGPDGEFPQGSYIGTMTRAGVPAPEVAAPIIAWIELLGGIFVLVGIFTRYTSVLLAAIMVVAIFTVKLTPSLARAITEDPWGLTVGGGWSFDLSLMVMALALLFMGPGKIALETMVFKREL